ncbi:EAL domain-containing protein [Clostridium sp.]|jgi:diguanylate cyclase (GGDEF)-like protein|uniref:EAL domain-containing protein n=1 Tax=Clostridium sp. TaxID=1506 RepID=UPI0025BA0F1C|nr:EAL domain-containing protein [Clostridium sp.]MCI2200309.1 EAL domain-containing protein [Clostridium sp.]
MKLGFSKVISLSELKALIRSFYKLTGIMCLIRYNGKNLSVFSNKNLLANFRFSNYDKNIIDQIKNHNKYGLFKSKSGLMYVGIPVYIEAELECLIFTTPIFYKTPDMKYLNDEIIISKLEKEKVLNCIHNIPLFENEKIMEMIKFLYNMVNIVKEITPADEVNYDRVYGKLHKNTEKFMEEYNSVKRKAYYDELTNLPNWNYLKERIEKYILLNPDNKFALFHIDLDNFKNINDIFGYKYGDRLLKKIGSIIKEIYNKNAIVARKYGNEFLVFKLEVDLEDLDREVQELLSILSGLWNLDGTEVLTSVRIGISIYPDGSNNAMGLIRSADIALNKAKLSGKNSYRVFEKSMYDEILRKSEMEKEIRKAIKNGEFLLYYQPQVDVTSNKVVSFEALIRWNSSRLGWIRPDQFIGLAEETGLIVPIGEWVFREACIQNVLWKSEGYDFDFISVNVSTVQLKNSNFIDMVEKTLEETGVDPESIEIEITESVAMESLEENIRVINRLKGMNIRIALDDFGSGYSSLNYLKSIPINTIKIDKTFIDGICEDSYESIITEQIINLAHRMKLDVIAEGVEFKDQFILLKMKKCNKIQGYYFGKPMPAEDIEGILCDKGDLN